MHALDCALLSLAVRRQAFFDDMRASKSTTHGMTSRVLAYDRTRLTEPAKVPSTPAARALASAAPIYAATHHTARLRLHCLENCCNPRLDCGSHLTRRSPATRYTLGADMKRPALPAASTQARCDCAYRDQERRPTKESVAVKYTRTAR